MKELSSSKAEALSNDVELTPASGLRSSIQLDPSGLRSDTVFVMGVPRGISGGVLQMMLSSIHPVLAMERDPKYNKVWAKYTDWKHALDTIVSLHQQEFKGKYLSVKFELGVDASGRPVLSRSSHNTIVRRVGEKPQKNALKETYTSKHIDIQGHTFPFPTGMYLARMISLVKTLDTNDPMMDLFTEGCTSGSKYSKEISESMAMVDCTERAIKMVLNTHPDDVSDVDVFVLGDGKRPLCAGCMHEALPDTWIYHSIDPIMDASIVYRPRISVYKKFSESFEIDSNIRSTAEAVVVIACHSHAPLQEFWDRLPSTVTKIAVAMPCCADYSELKEDPVFEFDDFEVYSPKRRICVYAQLPS
ncbi:hypothetical protein SARC_06999 [Sphaeroforma arctica JP610]|uniref:Uncharacterized protein n=1 Tax=Sphaeroforma arctica JP610 TaxID=667725 RepID=A0A0L0FVS4_9EUKA|nr:hypothetical protein SARC_06999 [Sphaeroforma arctica JP610]KNC80646.1 hypothetical protein SARC_06999 [Sphaeroforma arctica JP610]|eukprot:XP_014154548.1 hypothetical protein SARC_06999 [Sphaeroforma arctica JP610]